MGQVQGIKISYNTTFPLQFSGLNSFESLDEVRVIFRAEPTDILPGGKTNLNFALENPTINDHQILVRLIEIPPGFSVVGAEMEIIKTVPPKSTREITFELKSIDGIKPMTYWYGFDVIDEALGDDKSTVVNTSKLLNTYHGMNIIETETIALKEPEPIEPEDETGVFPYLLIAVFLVIVLAFLLRDRIRG